MNFDFESFALQESEQTIVWPQKIKSQRKLFEYLVFGF